MQSSRDLMVTSCDCFELVSQKVCNLPLFNWSFSNRTAKFSNHIANQIAIFHIELLYNSENCNLNPNRDCDLPINDINIVI